MNNMPFTWLFFRIYSLNCETTSDLRLNFDSSVSHSKALLVVPENGVKGAIMTQTLRRVKNEIRAKALKL